MFSALVQINKTVSASGIESALIHLLNVRISQINGCVLCVDIHLAELRDAGETQARIDQLAVWQESALFSGRERAALQWAESLTRLSQTRAPDEDYEAVRSRFSERELVDLTLAISVMNVWNRFGVGFRRLPAESSEHA